MDIDETDRKILQELEKDPRASNRSISEKAGLTPQAVGIRIKKMRDNGIIGGIKILKPLAKQSEPAREVKRIKTGIFGFDDYIGGGFSHPSTVLLVGESGAGTTIFGLTLLWEAMKSNLKCAYFAMERPIDQVKQQFLNFGWDLNKVKTTFRLIDGYGIIKNHIGEKDIIGPEDVRRIYDEIISEQKAISPNMNIMVFDNFTELLKLAKGLPMELGLINQLGINIMKYKEDASYFYVLKTPIISSDALLTLKSSADVVIQFRKEIMNQQTHYRLLIEKMILSDHPSMEIEFHITKEGIILNEHLLHQQALQQQPSSQGNALFDIPELDYLTQGLPFGSIWLLEVDNFFPPSDVLKIYVNFFINGIVHQRACKFVPPKAVFSKVIDIFEKAFQAHNLLRKKNITFEDQVLQGKIVINDYFNQSLILEDATKQSLFKRTLWSSESVKNRDILIEGLFKQTGDRSYYGIDLSDLLDLNLTEDQILELTKNVLPILQKRGDVIIVTMNPSIHSPIFVSKMVHAAAGIIRVWVKTQEAAPTLKYLQVVKTPTGTPSAAHLLEMSDIPPYIHLI
jgi:KaiC/GvpD/RAD55 family RecA-like ATPase